MVKNGDISGSIMSTVQNLTRILISILILLLGEVPVVLTFIELLTNQAPRTGVQGMTTACSKHRKK